MPNARRVQRATLTSSIESALRLDIIEGRLPPGHRLTAAELTERYEVSPTPLREALQRLAAENLVDIDPRLGATVAPISLAHLHDTYRVRELLETLAVEESVRAGDARWEARLRDLYAEFERAVEGSRDDPDDGVRSWSAAHRAFHEGLMAASDSSWLKSLLNIITNHSERYRMLAAQTGERDPLGEHVVIFEAALRRDEKAAAEALRGHLRRTVEVLKTSLPVVEDGAAPRVP
jgi:GntR family transcriptional regulator, carbon starvation induced regulator